MVYGKCPWDSSLRSSVGYVEQEDVFFPDLTGLIIYFRSSLLSLFFFFLLFSFRVSGLDCGKRESSRAIPFERVIWSEFVYVKLVLTSLLPVLVREHLDYAARLRLPRTMTRAQKTHRVVTTACMRVVYITIMTSPRAFTFTNE